MDFQITLPLRWYDATVVVADGWLLEIRGFGIKMFFGCSTFSISIVRLSVLRSLVADALSLLSMAFDVLSASVNSLLHLLSPGLLRF
jgi:hypothetical protein